MTNLQRLRARIEAGIAERIPVAILERAVERHTRRGIRDGCTCDWCSTKRNANYSRFMFMGSPGFRTLVREHVNDVLAAYPYLDVQHACAYSPSSEWEYKEEVFTSCLKTAREQMRGQFRMELSEIKERVL